MSFVAWDFITNPSGRLRKFLLTNLVECAVRGALQIGRIKVQIEGYYIAMGCCYFTGVDQP